MHLEEAFLQSAIKKFKAQKLLGDKTFEQLQDGDFFFKPAAESNSIAVIVQHMKGNMLSRWTNFLTGDGEKLWRQRDAEFEDVLVSKEDVLKAWQDGWQCTFNALQNLLPEDLVKTVTIRKELLLVVDATIRQIDHYGYHVGQIVFLGKIVKDKDWQTLSIAKNKSRTYKP